MKAVVFDLDDTLYPERQFVLSGFRAVAEWVRQKYGIQDFFPLLNSLFDQGQRGNIFDSALALCGIKVEARMLKGMVRVYRSHQPDIKLFEDAEPALIFCRQRYRTGLITDGYVATQRNKVQALNLSNRLDAVIFSGVFGRENWKPSPVPYREMCRLLDVASADCVYIGDNPAKDFITAKELHWLTIRVVREGTEHGQKRVSPDYEAHYTIHSLNEIATVLAEGNLA